MPSLRREANAMASPMAQSICLLVTMSLRPFKMRLMPLWCGGFEDCGAVVVKVVAWWWWCGGCKGCGAVVVRVVVRW